MRWFGPVWWKQLKVEDEEEAKPNNIMWFRGSPKVSFSFLIGQLFVCSCLVQEDEKTVDGGMLPDANGKDPNPGGQTESSKWQKPRLSRKSLMKCCLVKWIIASTTQQGPGRVAQEDTHVLTPRLTVNIRHSALCPAEYMNFKASSLHL